MDTPTIVSIIAAIVSIVTAAGYISKIASDNRNSKVTGNSTYLDSLVNNIKTLSDKNIDLQDQLDDKQKQIDDKQKQLDRLKEEMSDILEGKYQIVIDITTGKRFKIDDAFIKNTPASSVENK